MPRPVLGPGKVIRIRRNSRSLITIQHGKSKAEAVKLRTKKPIKSLDDVVKRVKLPEDTQMPLLGRNQRSFYRKLLRNKRVVVLDLSKFRAAEELNRFSDGRSTKCLLGIGNRNVLRKVTGDATEPILDGLAKQDISAHQPDWLRVIQGRNEERGKPRYSGFSTRVRLALDGNRAVVITPSRRAGDTVRLATRKPVESTAEVVKRVKVPADIGLPKVRERVRSTYRKMLGEGEVVLLDLEKFVPNARLKTLSMDGSQTSLLGISVNGSIRKISPDAGIGIVRWLNEQGHQVHQPYELSRMRFSYTGSEKEHKEGMRISKRKYDQSEKGRASWGRYYQKKRGYHVDRSKNYRRTGRGNLAARLKNAKTDTTRRLESVDRRVDALRTRIREDTEGGASEKQLEELRTKMRRLIG
ncbi:MAG: hypothetical protein JXB14_01055, partial [Candidatus Altiarchaeota archaeon]|nr:hypothetical protein [Candidatus Altiarchaeota archaeon]